MSTWHYEHGRWTENGELDAILGGAGDWRAARKQAGYQDHFGVGSEADGAFSVRLYSRDEPPRYLIEVTDLNRFDTLTAGTLPDALELLARYAPIVAAAEVADAISDIRTLTTYGIVTDILASVEANRDAARRIAAEERQRRQESARAWRERQQQR